MAKRSTEKKRIGRPPVEDGLAEQTQLRMKSDQKTRWTLVAKTSGLSLADFIRRTIDVHCDLLTDPVVVAAAKRQFLDPAAFVAAAVRRAAAAAEAPPT